MELGEGRAGLPGHRSSAGSNAGVAVNGPSCSIAVWSCRLVREQLEISACDAEV